MYSRAFRLLLLLSVLWTSAFAAAQNVSDVLTGGGAAPTIMSGDLKPEHKAFKVSFANGSSGGGVLDMIMGMFRGMAGAFGGEPGAPSDNGAMEMLGALELYWSDGRTLKVSGQEFLIAYRHELNLSVLGQAQPPKFDPEKTPMSLTLINLANVATLSPRPDMTISKFKEVLKKSAEMGRTGGAESATPVEASHKTQALSNIKQLATGMAIYMADYDDELPYAQSTAAVAYVTYPYIKSLDLWKSPNPNGGRILFNMALAGSNATAVEEPSNTILFYDSQPWPDGRRLVAMVDTSARFVDAETWATLSETLKLRLPKRGQPFPPDYGLDWANSVGFPK
jgi:hypothetical protein